MRTKDDGVRIENLCAQIKDKLPELDKITRRVCGTELVITSGNDGHHMQGSKHYSDEAIDIRTWYIPKQRRSQYIWSVEYLFHEPHFDIVDEQDHIHIEYDDHG
jgi:hypothetical protein